MGFFLSRSNRVLNMIESYISNVNECMECFKRCFEAYFTSGLCGEFEELILEVHRAESSADDSRREIELALYEKSLIPESRGDILGLLESVDRIPNKAESILFQIQTEALSIPDEFIPNFRKLVNINISAYKDITTAIERLFQDISRVKDTSLSVDKKESDSDAIERELIRAMFSSNMDIGEKILLKELVIEIGNISDRAEDVSDRLSIIAVKRPI